MVSTMLKEMRSILSRHCRTRKLSNQPVSNKDLSQHQLFWPGECFALYMNVSLLIYFEKFVLLMGEFLRKHLDYLWNTLQEILFFNFSPNISIEEKFYSDRSVSFLSKHSNKTLNIFSEKIEMAIASFSFSETFQNCCEIQFPSKISSPTQ